MKQRLIHKHHSSAGRGQSKETKLLTYLPPTSAHYLRLLQRFSTSSQVKFRLLHERLESICVSYTWYKALRVPYKSAE